MGDRIQNYLKTVFFADKTNHLIAELTFNKKASTILKSKKKLLESNQIFKNKVSIYQFLQKTCARSHSSGFFPGYSLSLFKK